MAKFTFEDILYNKIKKKEVFDFDKLMGPGIYHLLYESDLQSLYNIATSIKYSGALKKKYAAINEILKPRGFTHFHRGTNRVVYKHYENPNILLKVPIDVAGCSDGIMEFKNQNLLKPFVTKVFDVHPSGVSVHERVMPLTTYADFANFAYEYFQLVSHVFLGRFVMDDIGEGSFMNWGFRYGFGLVLLDFPYLYELDYQRLICHKIDPRTGQMCFGEIDYDAGFNHLVCKKCGMTYNAKDIGRFIQNHEVNIIKEEDNNMGMFKRKMVLVKGNAVLQEFGTDHMESDVIVNKEQFKRVDRIRQQAKPKPVEKKQEVSHRKEFKLVSNKPKETVEVIKQEPIVQQEVDNTVLNKEETETLIQQEVDNTATSKSDAEKYIENAIHNEDNLDMMGRSLEYDKEDQEVVYNEDGSVNEPTDNGPQPDSTKEEEDTAEADRFPKEDSKENEDTVEVDENPVEKLVNSLAVGDLEIKILNHFANLIEVGCSIDKIDTMIKPYVWQKFPDTADDVYTKYMNAVSKLYQYFEGEKAKVMEPQQVNTTTVNNKALYNEYFPVIDAWFDIKIDPRDNLIGISKEDTFVTFDKICSSLKESLSIVIKEEKVGNIPEDLDRLVDKIIQDAVNRHMDYMHKWADDIK